MTTVAAILKHKGYQVTTIEPTATIAQVVDVLAEHRIGAALVIDAADQLLGIVSERDIVRSLAANGLAGSEDAMQFLIDMHKAKATPTVGSVDWQGQFDLFKAGKIAIYHGETPD